MKVGDKITAVVGLADPASREHFEGIDNRTIQAIVTYVAPNGFSVHELGNSLRHFHRHRLDPLFVEGVGWCHGWEGRDVEALLTSFALR